MAVTSEARDPTPLERAGAVEPGQAAVPRHATDPGATARSGAARSSVWDYSCACSGTTSVTSTTPGRPTRTTAMVSWFR